MDEWKTFIEDKFLVCSNGFINTFHAVSGWRGPFQPEPDHEGYRIVCVDGKRYRVHSVVGECFVERPDTDEKLTIDHIDRDRGNNSASNLRWATSSEQRQNQTRGIPTQQCLPVMLRHREWGLETPALRFASCKEAAMFIGVTDVAVNVSLRNGWKLKEKQFTATYASDAESLDGEVWVSIPNGAMVSNMGRLRRPSSRNKSILSPPFTPKPSKDKQYALYKNRGLHLIVAENFLPPAPSPSHTVDHIDRNKANNAVSNLRWATKSEQSLNKGVIKPKKTLKRPVEARVADTDVWIRFKGLQDAATWLSKKRKQQFFANHVGSASKSGKLYNNVWFRIPSHSRESRIRAS